MVLPVGISLLYIVLVYFFLNFGESLAVLIVSFLVMIVYMKAKH